ncbi:MAG TPA: hypothetical protein VFS60_16385 [Thermoanaerobaculia bacterium]|nr:hypothetical protein [Thermoanaerobaculia bacterium]
MRVASAALVGIALLVLSCDRIASVKIERAGGTAIATDAGSSPAVLVHLRLAEGRFGSPAEITRAQDLELRVEKAIDISLAGQLDGNEIGDGEYVIYCYGPDADQLYAAIEPVLQANPWPLGGSVVKRHGPPGSRETTILLAASSGR